MLLGYRAEPKRRPSFACARCKAASATVMGESINVEIICVDPRVHDIPDGYVLRNAGANAMGFKGSLRRLRDEGALESITLTQHSECAAIGLLFGAFNGEVRFSESLKKWPPLKALSGRKFSSENELHKEYTVAQKEWLLDEFGVPVTVRMVDMKKLGRSGVHYPNEERRLLVAHSSEIPPLETIAAANIAHPEKTYMIMARDLNDIVMDIELAMTHIATAQVIFAARGSSEAVEMELLKRRVASAPYASAASLGIAAIDERQKSRR